MKRTTKKSLRRRRGVIAVLAAFMLVVLFGMIAFAVDLGYVSLVRTQLQATADAAALAAASRIGQGDMAAAAQDIASRNFVAGRTAQVAEADVQGGIWDTDSRTFTPSGTYVNAAKVTVRTGANHGGSTGLFFGRVLGQSSVDQSASAVATVNPRDIAFVVDLSSSMHHDTTPYNSSSSSTFMQRIYDDFGWGAYPGSLSNWNTRKTTKWLMKNTLKTLMPNAYPTPNANSSESRTYWAAYFEYLDDNGYKMGYKTYLQFLMARGRDIRIDGSTSLTSTVPYTAMSVNSPECHYHVESTDAGNLLFPAREMPTHAARRAMIAALQIVKERNATISDTYQRDWVSIVVFDEKNTYSNNTHVQVVLELTDDYDAAIDACRTLQACGSTSACTDTDGGILCAKNHIKPASEGGQGRERVNKVVVLLTDGMPNLYETSNSEINAAKQEEPSGWGSSYAQNGALCQAMRMRQNNWYLYGVGVGLGASQNFMDLLAVKSGTAKDGEGFAVASDITAYEDEMRNIFSQIITRPKLRLVQ